MGKKGFSSFAMGKNSNAKNKLLFVLQ